MSTPLIAQLRAEGFVAIAEIADADLAVPMAHALLQGGLHIVEVLLRTPDALSAIEKIKQNVPEMIVAAGTVLDVDQVARAVGAGADLAFAPGSSRDVVEACHDRGLLILPGVSTPTEIQSAREMGLTAMKFFPAEAMGGTTTIRTLVEPYPAISLIPTGSLTLQHLPDYLSIPQVIACGGNWPVSNQLLNDRDFDGIAEAAAEVRRAVDAARDRETR